MGSKGSKNKKGTPQKPPSHTEWPGAPSRPYPGTTTGGAGYGSGGYGGAGYGGAGYVAPGYPRLTEADYTFLMNQTGQSRHQIQQIFDTFMANNPDGRLDRREFVTLYTKLRPEDPSKLDEISNFVFRAFDQDRSGFIDFNEFMLLYDGDQNGYLDKIELREVINGMLDLLGADKRTHNAHQLAEECLRDLDVSRDGRVTKAEFIDGLMKNYSMRALLSPFN